MTILYRVYSNGGSGGPINDSSPIATVAGLTFTTGSLRGPGIYRFGVHAFDSSTGIEELNTQASVCIVLDANGNDVGQGPNAPYALLARPTSNGGCRVDWAYSSRGQAATPMTFLVYLNIGATPNLTTPVASAAYSLGLTSYGCQLSGLADGVTYTVAIVSQTAGGQTATAIVTTVVGDSTPPGDVDALVAYAVR